MSNVDTQFKPGQSGNPTGRPKKKEALTEILRVYSNKIKEVKDGKEVFYREALAKVLWDGALKGDIAFIKYIYDRCDGKPMQYVEYKDDTDNLDKIHIEEMEEDLQLQYHAEAIKQLNKKRKK